MKRRTEMRRNEKKRRKKRKIRRRNRSKRYLKISFWISLLCLDNFVDRQFTDCTNNKHFNTLKCPLVYDHINGNKTRRLITILQEPNPFLSARAAQRQAHEVQTTFRHAESAFSLAVIEPT
jgi:hypothetical protein